MELLSEGDMMSGTGKNTRTRSRRSHAPAFEAKIALAAAGGAKAIVDLRQPFDAHPNRITQWRNPLPEEAVGPFGGEIWEIAGFDLAV